MAANLSPKTVAQCTFTTISTRSRAQPQCGESDRAHFELLSHETFAKLGVGAIAFATISPLLHNLCLLLVRVRVIIFTLFILFRWNACWSTRSDALLFRHSRCPCCSCPLKEALYSEKVLLKFKSLAPKISRAPRMWVYNNDTTRSRTRIVKARVKHVRQYCVLCSYDCRDVKTKAISSKQWNLWTVINQAANALKGGKMQPALNEINCLQTLLSAVKDLVCNCPYWL